MAASGKTTNKSTAKTGSGTKKSTVGSANKSKKSGVDIPKIENTKKKQPSKSSSSAAQSESKQKRTETAKTAAERESLLAAKRQKTAIILFAAAVIFGCLAFIQGESLWLSAHGFLLKVCGVCAYVWPIALLYLAVVYAKNKTIASVAANISGGAAFIFLFEAAVHIITHITGDAPAAYFGVVSVGEQIKEVWTGTAPQKTGGVIGAAIGGLAASVLGKTGALIVIIVLLLVVLMFVTGMTLGGVFRTVTKPAKKMGEMASEKIEMNQLRREQKELIRAEKEAEKKQFNPPTQKKKEKQQPREDDNIIRDETTFTIREKAEEKPAEVKAPVLPVIEVNEQSAKAEPSVEDIMKAAAEERKKKLKKPAPPVEKQEKQPAPEEESAEKSELLIPEFKSYKTPPIDCLDVITHSESLDTGEEQTTVAKRLISTLESFNVKARVVGICTGPSVTRYEIEPDEGIRISKITKLADDIALRLAASGVRIAAIPNRTAIGIEVPNRVRDTVGLREVIDTGRFRDAKSKLNVALGKDIAGNLIFADLAKMPHLLIAGTTGSGKSVCLNTMIVSILYNASPDEVKIVLIDPKMVEFAKYNGIAHLEVPVVSKPRKAAGALGWAVSEMEKRYQLFADHGVSDIKGYNKLAESRLDMKKMHQVVIFIDELSDLMMVAPNEVEDSICRLAQMARAAGMHLVVATQRPSVNVITGVIKANIPSRIALSVSSQVDSRTILDASGAEKLLGNGHMLFAPIGSSKPQRLQGCFVSDEEIDRVVSFIKENAQTEYNDEVIKAIDSIAAASENAKKKGSQSEEEPDSNAMDDSLIKALEVLIKAGKASTTFLQNKLGWGYPKAARVMNELEEKGFIPPKDGNKERRVLITLQQFYEMQANSGNMSVSGYSSEGSEEDFNDYPEYDDFSDYPDEPQAEESAASDDDEADYIEVIDDEAPWDEEPAEEPEEPGTDEFDLNDFDF